MPRRFRVLSGRHQEIVRAEDRSTGVEEKRVLYGPGCAAGDIVETDDDLLRHNAKGLNPKFATADEVRGYETEDELARRIEEDTKRLAEMKAAKGSPSSPSLPVAPANPHVAAKAESDTVRLKQLNAMSVKQLQDIAATDEIEVANCKSKEDYIKAILGK